MRRLLEPTYVHPASDRLLLLLPTGLVGAGTLLAMAGHLGLPEPYAALSLPALLAGVALFVLGLAVGWIRLLVAYREAGAADGG